MAGLLFDFNGNPLTSSHTVKNGKRYRYYVGTRIEHGKPKPWRLPAHEIESVVLKAAQEFLGDRQRVATALKRSRLQARKLKDALEIASDLSAQIDAFPSRRETALKLIKRVVVSDSQLVIEVKLDALMSDDARVRSTVNPPPHHTYRPGSAGRRRNRDCKRIRSQRQGRSCTRQSAGARLCLVRKMATGGADTVTAIAKRERVTDRYVSQLIELAFIDPRIVQRALAGTARSTNSTRRSAITLASTKSST